MSTGSYGFDEDDEEEVEDSNTTMLKKIECEGHRLEWVESFTCLIDSALYHKLCIAVYRIFWVKV